MKTIKEERIKQEISKAEMGRRLDVTYLTYHLWETERHKCPMIKYKEMMQVLGIKSIEV